MLRKKFSFMPLLVMAIFLLMHSHDVSAAFTRSLDRGMTGPDVAELQQLLKDRGFFPLNQSITTYYGLITEKAVTELQASTNLETVGRVGPKRRFFS